MLISVLIIVASSLLFLYWFRYACLLLLNRSRSEYARRVASTIRLSFPQVQAALRTPSQAVALDHLHRSLEYDYQLIMDLLGQAAGGQSVERRILTIDYKIMRTWYKATRAVNPLQAKMALSEMSSILGYFAGELGERA